MQIKATPITKYSLELEGKPLGVFTLESKWQGMALKRERLLSALKRIL